MTRLTSQLKQDILFKVLEDAFHERCKVHKAREHALAYLVRDQRLGEHKKAFLSLPPELVWEISGVRVAISGLYTHLGYGRQEPTPHNLSESLDPKTELGAQVAAYIDNETAMRKEQREISAAVNATLNSVTTVKRLLEVWPEAAKYLPKNPDKPQLPALRIDDLNARIAAAKARKDAETTEPKKNRATKKRVSKKAAR
jgi:hypothetical protein